MIQRYTPMQISWNPLAEMAELHRTVNRIFGTANGFAEAFPPANLFANEEEAVVSVEVPGVDKENLEISVNGNSLTLSGSREAEELGQEARLLRGERFQGRFQRTIELPFNVESDQVKANLRHGILEIRLPRAESDKPRKINIEA